MEETVRESSYEVNLESFQGPLDLLLYLIKRDEVDIYDIPIAKITGQYLDYLNLMEELNLELAAEFLLMAATLIQIKLRMLLPADREGTEEGEDEDPRSNLVQQLLEYQKYKKASVYLRRKEEEGNMIYFRHARAAEEFQVDGEILVEVLPPFGTSSTRIRKLWSRSLKGFLLRFRASNLRWKIRFRVSRPCCFIRKSFAWPHYSIRFDRKWKR